MKVDKKAKTINEKKLPIFKVSLWQAIKLRIAGDNYRRLVDYYCSYGN